jgi:hypothetical protein
VKAEDGTKKVIVLTKSEFNNLRPLAVAKYTHDKFGKATDETSKEVEAWVTKFFLDTTVVPFTTILSQVVVRPNIKDKNIRTMLKVSDTISDAILSEYVAVFFNTRILPPLMQGMQLAHTHGNSSESVTISNALGLQPINGNIITNAQFKSAVAISFAEGHQLYTKVYGSGGEGGPLVRITDARLEQINKTLAENPDFRTKYPLFINSLVTVTSGLEKVVDDAVKTATTLTDGIVNLSEVAADGAVKIGSAVVNTTVNVVEAPGALAKTITDNPGTTLGIGAAMIFALAALWIVVNNGGSAGNFNMCGFFSCCKRKGGSPSSSAPPPGTSAPVAAARGAPARSTAPPPRTATAPSRSTSAASTGEEDNSPVRFPPVPTATIGSLPPRNPTAPGAPPAGGARRRHRKTATKRKSNSTRRITRKTCNYRQ